MSEQIQFFGVLLRETEMARLIQSDSGESLWIPKSVFTYWRKDHSGITFSVEGWKVRDVQACDFDEL